METLNFDVVVVGSGIGGLSYALAVAQGAPELKVAIVTKKERRESNTNYAQGGIASVMSPLDSFESHIQDTLKTGGGLCNPEVVERVVKAGPGAIRRLAQIGVEFTRSESQKVDYDLALEGGHSHKRVVHADDLTGREVEQALLTRCSESSNVSMFENHLAADILTHEDSGSRTAVGALVFDANRNCYMQFSARIIMLATGGVGQVYAHTTNPLIATGDGIAMAYRAGCSVANLEFVQFHPTAFYEDTERSLLITEAVRGHGGVLRTIAGRAFMKEYDERGDLAPRDIVARAIDKEMKLSGDSYVHLDMTLIPHDEILSRFPNIYKGCLKRGVDITKEPIPVVPSAHYLCGGVRATLEGITDVRGLLVCGETAHTGMHGANRLASNSLLEAVVMAEFAAGWTLENVDEFAAYPLPDTPAYAHNDARQAEGVILAHERQSLKRLMSDYLGIVRSLDRLSMARERIMIIADSVQREFAQIPDVYGALELRNMTEVALLMVEMAMRRHESRGLHYLLDFPERNDAEWKHDSVIYPSEENKLIPVTV